MTSAQMTASRYQQTQVQTADRGQLLLLVFDGALKFLRLSENAARAGDDAQFCHNLGRAQSLIAELLHTLNHKDGGEIASNLDRLYRFMLEHLVEANLQRSERHISDVVRLLSTIAGAYREILQPGVARVAAA